MPTSSDNKTVIAPPPKLKIPDKPGELADLYYKTLSTRLEADRVAAAWKEQETALAEHIINTLPKSEATGIAGKVARVFIREGTRPEVKDWNAVYKYILAQKKPEAFALLQRRLSKEAVEEVWAAKKKIPGVEPFVYKKIGYSKL